MKLFIKILSFVFVALIANAKVVVSAPLAFTDILQITTSSSFHRETQETVPKVIANNLINSCQNEPNLVDFRNLAKCSEVYAANTGENLAFGLRENLNEFSQATGFINYRQFTSGGFKADEILSAIENPGNNLHFNLTGFSKYRYSKFVPVAPLSSGNITNWELHSIYNTPGALQRTTFYNFSEGSYQTVPKPF
jgi:hypothetical protein